MLYECIERISAVSHTGIIQIKHGLHTGSERCRPASVGEIERTGLLSVPDTFLARSWYATGKWAESFMSKILFRYNK